MQTACIPRVLPTEKFLFSNSYSPGWEKVGIIHRTEESFTSTNIVTWCQVSHHVTLFYGKWWKIGRRDYDICSTFDGVAVWKIPVKLHFPGCTKKLAVFTLLVHWHRSVLYCMQLCYTHMYISTHEHNLRSTKLKTGRQIDNQWNSHRVTTPVLIFIKNKAAMWQH